MSLTRPRQPSAAESVPGIYPGQVASGCAQLPFGPIVGEGGRQLWRLLDAGAGGVLGWGGLVELCWAWLGVSVGVGWVSALVDRFLLSGDRQ
jgi:hypothetical protein